MLLNEGGITAPGLLLCLLCARERTEEVVRRPFREGTLRLQRREMLGAPRSLETQHSTSVWHWTGYGVTQDYFKATHICLPAHFIKFSDLSHTTTVLRAHAGKSWRDEIPEAWLLSAFPPSSSPHRGLEQGLWVRPTWVLILALLRWPSRWPWLIFILKMQIIIIVHISWGYFGD